MKHLRHLPFEDLGFAKVDHHRAIRCGFPEVIYCEGKTIEQVVKITEHRLAAGGNLLATRVTPKTAKAMHKRLNKARYNELARTITLRQSATQPVEGFVAIVCAGTSDLFVAEERAKPARSWTSRRVYDCGVAGIHRLLRVLPQLRRTRTRSSSWQAWTAALPSGSSADSSTCRCSRCRRASATARVVRGRRTAAHDAQLVRRGRRRRQHRQRIRRGLHGNTDLSGYGLSSQNLSKEQTERAPKRRD